MKKLLLCLIVMPTICFFAACGEKANIYSINNLIFFSEYEQSN